MNKDVCEVSNKKKYEVNQNMKVSEAEVLEEIKRKPTPDEKRLERIRKLCMRVCKIKERDIRELPEWRQKQVRDMLEEMVSHSVWIHRTLEEKEERDKEDIRRRREEAREVTKNENKNKKK